MTLLEKFAHSELINSLSLGEKALGSSYVAILGMSITFLALIILMTSLVVMSKVFNPRPQKNEFKPPPPLDLGAEKKPDQILLVVLAAAAYSVLGKPVRIIRARPLKRSEDTTPVWGKAGRLEQIKGGNWKS